MDLSYYQLTKTQRFKRKISSFFKNIGKTIGEFFVNIFKAIIGFFLGIGKGFKEFGLNFWYGDALTKSSHFVLGLSHLFRGQIVRGIIYIILEAAFIVYMVLFGGNYLTMCFENLFTGGNIGRTETYNYWNEELGFYDKMPKYVRAWMWFIYNYIFRFGFLD